MDDVLIQLTPFVLYLLTVTILGIVCYRSPLAWRVSDWVDRWL